MQLLSPAFSHNEPIPAKFTCKGENVSPPLEWVEAPDDTQSFVLIVDDPDAPNGDWVHWLIWNMNPETKSLSEDHKPKSGIEGTTSFGRTGYDGPCPPSGTHHYFFKLYALSTPNLDLDASATKAELEAAMEGNVITKAELIGTFSK